MQSVAAYSARRGMRRMRSLRLLAVALWLNGCFAWRPAPLTPTRKFRPTEDVRVRRSGDGVTVLREVRFAGDSLVGLEPRSSKRASFPLVDVRQIETLRVQKGRTLTAIVLVVGIPAILIADGLSNMRLGSGAMR